MSESTFMVGLNLSHWFAQVPHDAAGDLTWDHTWMPDADIVSIARAGFDHVRIPFDISTMAATSGMGRTPAIERVVVGTRRALDAGLSVILDGHPEEPDKARLKVSKAFGDEFCDRWFELATMLQDVPRERIMLEPLNEPMFWEPHRWNALQNRIYETLEPFGRRVLVCGDGYSSIDQLVAMGDAVGLPLAGNDLAVFHLYDPQALTHQGTPWSPAWLRSLSGLDYPVTGLAPDELRMVYDDWEQRSRIEEFQRAGWHAGTYTALIDSVVDWAQGRPLICTEFGIFRGVRRSVRIAWLRDVVAAFRRAGIGWSLWDYAGDFAIATGTPGSRVFDEDILDALESTKAAEL